MNIYASITPQNLERKSFINTTSLPETNANYTNENTNYTKDVVTTPVKQDKCLIF
jgi:hypothetical protein